MAKQNEGKRTSRIALEGPCLAGKTTAGRWLVANLPSIHSTYVTDYSDFVGGGRFLPPAVPASWDEESVALQKLLEIEFERTRHVGTAGENLVVIDRSIHTLLAHCSGLERATQLKCLELAADVVKASPIPLWPDMILYFDVSRESAERRNKGKFPNDSIFINHEYNAGFRSYFEYLDLIGGTNMIWIDASREREVVAASALESIGRAVAC